MTEQNQVPIHNNVYCDECNIKQYIRGVRHKCGHCPDFDLCETCHRYTKHDPSHWFILIKQPYTGNPLKKKPLLKAIPKEESKSQKLTSSGTGIGNGGFPNHLSQNPMDPNTHIHYQAGQR